MLLSVVKYRGIKLLDQVMKVMERVIEKRIRSRVQLDEMPLDSDQEGELQMLYSLLGSCRRSTLERRKSCGWRSLI